ASVRLHVPGGEIYREQNIILSPFEHDGVSQYAASKMFIGAGALSRRGLLQVDSILIQAEKRLLARAEELIVLADSSKFVATASLILCGLDRIDRVVTDDGIPEEARLYLERAGIAVQIVDA
ncbi:MAG: DeoR/GlpR transcriptional regulator, partial [Pseudomonadota bacterium]